MCTRGCAQKTDSKSAHSFLTTKVRTPGPCCHRFARTTRVTSVSQLDPVGVAHPPRTAQSESNKPPTAPPPGRNRDETMHRPRVRRLQLQEKAKHTARPAPLPWATGTMFIILSLAIGIAGCDRDPRSTPEEALAAWVAAMNASRTDISARRQAYDLLAQRARASLQERAARASQLSGLDIQPWEMLAPGRFALRFTFDPRRLRATITGHRAVVTVVGPGGDRASVPMVREDGQWRVDLTLPPMQPTHADTDGGT